MIAHPGEEVAYVLFGEIELLLGDEIHRLSQGDLVRFRTETLTPIGMRPRSGWRPCSGSGRHLGRATEIEKGDPMSSRPPTDREGWGADAIERFVKEEITRKRALMRLGGAACF